MVDKATIELSSLPLQHLQECHSIVEFQELTDSSSQNLLGTVHQVHAQVHHNR